MRGECRWWGATLSRPPSSVSFSVDAAGSGSSVSLFFLVDDHLAASRSECLLLRVSPLETRGDCFVEYTRSWLRFETRVERSSQLVMETRGKRDTRFG